MRRRAISSVQIIGLIGIAATPLAIHVAIVTSSWTRVIVAIPLLQLVMLGIAATLGHPVRVKWLAAAAAVLILALVWAQRLGLDLRAVPGIPHALAYTMLLVVFGGSLLPGREPILSRVVVAVRGPLPDELIVHTRRVTWAWCFFFAAQLIVSVVLFVGAPIEIWSLFVNVLNLPLVLAMFCAECGYRLIRFRDLDSLSDIMRVVAKTMDNGSRQADSA